MQVVAGGVEEQTQQALKNLKAVIEASGSELGKVVKTTVSFFNSSFNIHLALDLVLNANIYFLW